jgi:t-SNARE complex subunit (syntaxin)
LWHFSFLTVALRSLSIHSPFRYKAQSDVLRQLEQRLREQILSQRQRYSQNTSHNDDSSSSQKQALLKLERDFERVQTSVQATKAKVSRQMKQYQQRQAAAAAAAAANDDSSNVDYSTTNSSNNTMLLQQQYAQQQLQLQQDRLQEEIMREREEEIRKINRGMHQVNEIYKDLAHIVGSQQEQVDQIEDKMEDARNTAQSGLDQVHKANEKYGTNQCVIS